ncbi:MAG: Rieske 2Fe-2S domain-containing protein [Betaproteobacteria bacterium]|nr:Rieske 2Fe-2S domain-containing protein [Betaproteobacteria bacterium]
MTILLDDRRAAQRILDHIENRTTDLGGEIWREPVANYRSEERLAMEVQQVFKRTPTPFCPSAALPQAGAYVAREAAGTPILAVRGEDGTVRAFRNACRHRGMAVANATGCAKSFVCGYHGWTYRLDGSLRHIPHEHGFPGLDKSTHGLAPLRAEESCGMVFVTQDTPALEDPALDELAHVFSPEQQLFATRERDIAANWKILLEGFIEGYHIRATHPETFYPYGFDNLNLVEPFGRNSRVTYPFQRIAKLARVAREERRVDGLLTYVYHLFPNVLITVLSRHTNVVVLEPLGIDSTRNITYTLTNRGADQEEMLREAKRDAAFVGEVGAAEDRAVVCAIQRGLGSGANEVFTFGKFEGAIAHFHRTLKAALAGRAPAA